MPVYNFAAGPAMLPQPVIKQIKEDLPSFDNSGMSVMEISHRSNYFEKIIDQAQENLRKLMGIPEDYEILFLQGGATTQFAAIPLNIAFNKNVGLVDTGHWAIRAMEETKRAGINVETIASSKDDHYRYIPQVPENIGQYDYIHITANNTIEGTAYHQIPDFHNPIVADVSSNFLAEEYDVSDFDVVYGGAQKNLGIAGLTIVIIKKSLLKENNLPSMLNYPILAKKNSMLNTPPVFAIYAAKLVMDWIVEQGGVTEMQRRDEKKSQYLYDFLDQSQLFHNYVNKKDRSLTNIIFTTDDEKIDQEVIDQAKECGLLNIKGHRLLGGMRASLYNAMPFAGAEKLVDFLDKFEKNNRGTK